MSTLARWKHWVVAACMAATPVLAAEGELATATFIDTQGRAIGTATLVQTPNGVLISAELKGLPPGELAFHVHETGRCDPADQFRSAGGHFNPSGHDHGFLAADGAHAGDMPNQFAHEDGTLRVHVFNPRVTLGAGEESLLGGDGTSLVLHAKPDDYRSQPAGNAGDRIACAVIERPARKAAAD
jgi:superoxide dismutase, Cu-Zn family